MSVEFFAESLKALIIENYHADDFIVAMWGFQCMVCNPSEYKYKVDSPSITERKAIYKVTRSIDDHCLQAVLVGKGSSALSMLILCNAWTNSVPSILHFSAFFEVCALDQAFCL